jgi:hypothetical protein
VNGREQGGEGGVVDGSTTRSAGEVDLGSGELGAVFSPGQRDGEAQGGGGRPEGGREPNRGGADEAGEVGGGGRQKAGTQP